MEIQARDLQILRGLFESRIMTAKHVADIYFGGRYEAARKRLQGLKAGGYVRERPRRVYDPAILILTKKGFVVLCERGTIADLPRLTWAALEKRVRVSELTLRHELAVMDVKAALVKAVRQEKGWRVAEFTTWPLLYEFEARRPSGERVSVKPDGFLRVREVTESDGEFEHLFFLEVDRSTEPQETLAQRAACYRSYYADGGLAERYGYPKSQYERFPFRVLMAFANAERRNNVAERLLRLDRPILTQVWLTTFAEFTTTPLGAIWVRPVDYRDAVRAGPYAGSTVRGVQPYRRQPGREPTIDAKVTKVRLLGSGSERPAGSA